MTSQLKMDQESIFQYLESTSSNSTQPSNLFELQPNLTDRSIGIMQSNHILGALQSFLIKIQENKAILVHLQSISPEDQQQEFQQSITSANLFVTNIAKMIQQLTTPNEQEQLLNFKISQHVLVFLQKKLEEFQQRKSTLQSMKTNSPPHQLAELQTKIEIVSRNEAKYTTAIQKVKIDIKQQSSCHSDPTKSPTPSYES